MGYYSEVGICLKKKDYEELKRRAEVTNNDAILDLLDFANTTIIQSDNAIVLHWDSLKWYPSFQEVEFSESFLQELKEKGEPYSFVRVGEDYDDIEKQEYYGRNEDYSCAHIEPSSYINIY